MKIWKTTDPTPTSTTEQYHVYNALDACVTYEVHEVLYRQLDEITSKTYELSKALQGPIIEMNARGVLIDIAARNDMLLEFGKDLNFLEEALTEIIQEGLGTTLQWSSPKQLAELLYDVMGLPEQKNVKTGSRTVGEPALRKLSQYFYAKPIINHILTMRDIGKAMSTLRTEIDTDNRMRTQFSIAGTKTGRFSSYESINDMGTNLQNQDDRYRYIYIADPGMKLAYIDLEQAESRTVGAIEWNLFQDGRYLDAAEGPDLHTTVARMCWPHLPWTGDIKKDKAWAKSHFFFREEDYRQGAKKLSHASNYHGQPTEIARQTGIPVELVKDFQPRYFKAFPAHQKWHAAVGAKILKDGWMTTFLGRRRTFWGRRWDNTTLNTGIAYEPQSTVADYLSRGILNIWRDDICKNNQCQLLLQIHDALLIQYPEELENEIVPKVQKMMEIEIPLLHDRTLVIPTEALIGWNWGYSSDKNPNGLIPFNGNDQRKRIAHQSILDRKFSET